MELRKYRSAGMKFNAYIVALLNAALVEEMAEYGIPNMNFNVIGDIETIYIHNRKAASSKMTINGKTDFYKWLSECPLLEIFLNPFLKYLMQNDIEEKEQYLNELLKYDQMNNKLALLYFLSFYEESVSLSAIAGILLPPQVTKIQTYCMLTIFLPLPSIG